MALVILEYLVVHHYLEAPVDQVALFLPGDLVVQVNLYSEEIYRFIPLFISIKVVQNSIIAPLSIQEFEFELN